jgi:predicted metal-binding membrane protein
VLLEKAVPFGRLIGRLAGVGFIAGGAWLLFQAS